MTSRSLLVLTAGPTRYDEVNAKFVPAIASHLTLKKIEQSSAYCDYLHTQST